MIVLDYLVHSHIVLASKSVKLLRLELYGNDIYTSLQAKIRPYRPSQMIALVSFIATFLDSP